MIGGGTMRAAALAALVVLVGACSAATPTPSPGPSVSPGASASAAPASPSMAPSADASPSPASPAASSPSPAASPAASATPDASATPLPAPDGTWVAAGTLASQSWDVLPTVALGDGGAITIDGRDRAVERWDPATGTWHAAAGLNAPREYFAAVALRDGRALVVGGVDTTDPEHWRSYSSAYAYDPASPEGAWAKTGLLGTARTAPAAAVLPDGRVLVAGGSYIDGAPYGYGGSTGIELASARMGPGSGMNGRVDADMAPWYIGVPMATAEILDPATGRWTPTGSMRFARVGAVATTLSDGRVLVVGPSSGIPEGVMSRLDARVFDTAEVYDPATGRFALVGSLPALDRAAIAADGVALSEEYRQSDSYSGMGTLVALPDGGALLVGHRLSWKYGPSVTRTFRFDGSTGRWTQVGQAYADFYDMETGTFSQTPGIDLGGALVAPLPDGRVLAAGGSEGKDEGAVATAQAYDPPSGAWLPLPSMPAPRDYGTAAALADRSVLLVGGARAGSDDAITAVRFVPSP